MDFDVFSGIVVHGLALGRTIGFPTANVAVSDGNVPKNGVYLVEIFIFENKHFGIMNVGTRPTTQRKELSVEVHIFDFQNDIYNQTIYIKPLYFLREEQKFENINLLKTQIQIDKQNAMNVLKNFK